MERSESQFKDSNFFCVEESKKDIEYLYVYYVVEKFAVDRVAFACFVRLLNESNLIYKNQYKKHCLASKYYSTYITFDYEELPYNYILKAKVLIPSYLNDLSKRNMKKKVDVMVHRIISNSWTKRESDLQRVKDEIRLEESQNSSVNINKLRHLFYSNFDKKHIALSYKYYGVSKGLDSLKRISLDKVRDVILHSERMVFFYGDSEYKRMLNVISLYKPTPKIFPVSQDDSHINTIRELISNDIASNKGLVLAFQKPRNNCERNYILNMLVAELFLRSKKGQNGLIGYDTNLFDEYLRLYFYETSLDKEKIKRIVEETSYSNFDEKEFNELKTYFKGEFENKFHSIDKYFDFLSKMRLCGFSTERATYINILDSLTFEELINFVKTYRYVSSLAVELEDKKEENYSLVKFDLNIGKTILIKDEMKAYYLRKASYFMFTYFSKKMDRENLFISPLEASIKTMENDSFLEISFYTSSKKRVFDILKKSSTLVKINYRNFRKLKRYLKGKLSEETFLESNEFLSIAQDKRSFKVSYKDFKAFLKNVERLNNSIFLQRDEGNL